jgi:hypothetical protein
MEELHALCGKKGYFLGVIIKPYRKSHELKENDDPASLVVVISTERPLMEHILISDEVTESLSVTAKFLLEELKAL